ncbi:endonuclease VII domain-containing protein [Streptomyces sp. NPDC050636]|uniref:endonuclease VII domain-containing protein n=1 Tax=Streptomyces sp. NPDC050636 TaxID=3154510 RepID=UPI0034288166
MCLRRTQRTSFEVSFKKAASDLRIEGSGGCVRCGETTSHAAFARKRSNLDHCRAQQPVVQPCRAASGRVDHRRRKYGMTEAQRDEMIASQMALCAICLKAPAVHVDHCHKTGRVRGVLCFNCNSGLGLLRDDPAAVNRAADYLEGNAWKPTLVAPGDSQQPS